MRTCLNPCETLILDIDFSDMQLAISFVEEFSLYVSATVIKSNTIYSKFSGLFSSSSQDLYARLREAFALKKALGQKVFLDLHINGSPEEIDRIFKDISTLTPKMFSVDVLSGRKSIERAVANKKNAKVFGSLNHYLDPDEYFSIFGTSADSIICKVARILVDAGADGIMCTCLEARILRQFPQFENLLIACPIDITSQNQNPRELIGIGIDYLIIGKPIVKEPAEIMGLTEVFQILRKEIALGLLDRRSLSQKLGVI